MDVSVWDIWRSLNLFINVMCIIWLIGGLKRQRKNWNFKTINLWYSRLLWAVTGGVLSFEGLSNDRDWSYTLAFVTIASVFTFYSLLIRGTWGYEPETAMLLRKKSENSKLEREP